MKDEIELPTAAEAAKRVRDGQYAKAVEQKQKVHRLISDAINAGQTSVSVDGSLDASVQDYLRGLGYRVNLSSQYNESYTSIAWL